MKEITNPARYREHRATLKHPWQFYAAMARKLIPGVSRSPIHLSLIDDTKIVIEDFMTLYIYTEIFVDRCYDWEFNADHSPRILDVGGNTGLFALRMKQLFPKSVIRCFEPFPANFAKLKNTIDINQLSDVKAYMQGVGAKARQERLYVHPRNLGGHSIVAADSSKEFIDIELIDLHTAISALPEARCDLLKLDCEGAEKEILESITPELATCIPRIVFEPTPQQYSVRELLHRLQSLKYKVHYRHGLYFANQ